MYILLHVFFCVRSCVEKRYKEDTAGWQQDTLQERIEEGYVDGVRRLLLLGVNTTDEDYDPLVYATQLGHHAIVRLLLIAGSDPDTLCGSAMIEAARLI